MSGFSFTENQQRALALDGGKLVLAGAGSGKTTVLVERYLRLLAPPEPGEAPVEPRQIVAMTYTRPAAAQLQAGIHKNLLERERRDPEHATHWRVQREAMSWARIGTIHGFCSSLLRAYPLEAGVDPDFTVDNTGDPTREERLEQHLRRLSRMRDPDLAILVDALGGYDKILALVRLAAFEPDLADALGAAAENPTGAKEWLDGALRGMHAAYGTPREERPEPGEIDHTRQAHALAALGRVAAPLRPAPEVAPARLTYDDLEWHALKLLRGGSRAVQQILRGIRYLFVDEFQDTSSRQWQIVQLLAHGAGGDAGLERDRLFLVGDEKQSIYGFRRADVTVVRRAESLLAALPGRGAEWRVDLADNFRTAPPLLEAMNPALNRLLTVTDREPLPLDAAPQDLEAKREVSPGIGTAPPELAVGMGWSWDEGFTALAGRIRREVDSGEVIVQGENGPRPLAWEDIGILMRKRIHLPELERALRAGGVPYTLVKSKGFLERQEVRDMVHLLAALADPRDHMALTGTLRSPLFSLPDTAFAALFLGGDDPRDTWRRLLEDEDGVRQVRSRLSGTDLEALERALVLWRDLDRLAEHAAPAEVLLTALERSGAWAAYATGDRGTQRIANLYRIVDLVRGEAGKGHYTLRRLNDRLRTMLEEAGEEQSSEPDPGAGRGVKLMTVHAAKGLEFPYVILLLEKEGRKTSTAEKVSRGHLLLPDHEDRFAPLADPRLARLALAVEKDDAARMHQTMRARFEGIEEEAEQRRLLYVALTRVRDRLLCWGIVPKSRGRVEYHPGSDLGRMVEAVGATEKDLKSLEEERQFDGWLVSPIRSQEEPLGDAEPPPVEEPGTLAPEAPGDDPGVRLVAPPLPDRWQVPVTAFADYLVSPGDEALRKLLWYAAVTEAGDAEPRDDAAPGDTEQLLESQDRSRRVAAWIGELVHRLYQRLGPGCGWDDAGDEVERELELFAESPEEAKRLRERIRELLERGRTTPGLNAMPANALRELPLALRLGDVTLRGRADAAWVEDGVAVAVDYKTNRVEAGGAERLAQLAGYDHQAKLYALALARAWGADRAECRLVFLDAGEEVRYPLADGDEERYRAAAQTLNGRWRAWADDNDRNPSKPGDG